MARTKTSASHHEAQQKQVRNTKVEIAEEFVTDVKEENQIAKKRSKQQRKRSSEPTDAKSKNVKGPR
ncbi:hypothetical protein [Calidifontibacillus oryziterrae]|uniref:hypothetical protein n=1 Tax=Calidifontibacillus oryziterrae TaxID=1191699 RepID=UPI0002FBB07C|nr:hypothetical protein [Calidifontibacillus oryziterrae]